MKRFFALLLTLTMVVTIFAGCGGKDKGNDAPTDGAETPATSEGGAASSEPTAGGKIKLVYWHSMGGRNAEAMDKLIAEYNASQDKYEVEGQYQGAYDDAIQKLRSTTPGTGPDIMQLYDIGTRWMIDSGYALKMQDFIDAEGYDMSDYEENILAYYVLNDELYSMPFNCSSPVIVYNKEALEKAGLEPETAFATIESCKQTAEKLVADGGMTVGGTLTNYGWIFEQFMSMQGKPFVDNGNGRDDRATKMVIDENGAGIAVLNNWLDFASQPYTDTFGTGPDEAKKQFATGTVGFLFESCAVYENVQAAAGDAFSVGFAPMPLVNAGDVGGNSVGGGSLWVMDNASDEKAQGAWDFVKFVTQPEQQAQWSMGTGYFPIRISANDLPEYKDYTDNVNPELKVALQTLRNSKPEYAGAVMGVFPKARSIVQNEIEIMINDDARTAEETLNQIVTQINEEIELYNKTN